MFRPEHLRTKVTAEGWGRPRNPTLFFVGLAVLVGTFVAFVGSSFSGFRLSLVALGGGAVMFFLIPVAGNVSARDLLGRVDWSILVFFLGLFLVLGGLEATDAASHINGVLVAIAPGGLANPMGLHVASALLSNLVSNVPAVLLLAAPVGAIGSEAAWLGLASSSTLAGNATLLGAASNVIAVEVARKEGVEVRFLEFLALGLAVTVATLGVSIAFFVLW